MNRILDHYAPFLVGLLLAAITCLAYLPTGDFGDLGDFDFINYDDNIYVYENSQVQQGITGSSILWAFTTDRTGNYHPLTWLSLMLDHSLFGLEAGGYHLVNFTFHLLNTLLLFWVFHLMTGSIWRSGLVAALFAVHPLHVESVAWVAERKDVLSTLFWLLTMWAYFRYTRQPSWRRMTLVTLMFGLGLLAKPMLVTLPCVLLLCDLWPLGRLRPASLTEILQQGSRPRWVSLVLEKWPLFLLAIGFAAITLKVQQQGGNVAGMSDITVLSRLVNAVAGYFAYVHKLFWPTDLAVLYPYRTSLPIWQALAGLVLLAAGLTASWRAAVKRPYLTVGLLWYFGTMVPVIGLIQVGNHFIADRYTYVPYIGLFIVIAWGLPDLLARLRLPRWGAAAVALAAVAVLLVLCRTQVGYWRDGLTLFSHSLVVTKDNFLLHNNMGAALTAAGRTEEAIDHYRQAVAIKPDYETPLNNLGLLSARGGQVDAAIDYYQKALAANPNYAIAHFNLANALVEQREIEVALPHYRAAVQLEPEYQAARYNYAMTLARSGQLPEAIEQYRQVLRLDPSSAKAYNDLGNIAVMQEELGQAAAYYQKAIAIDPGYADAYHNLGIAMIRQDMASEALVYFEKAAALDPASTTFQETLAKARQFVRQRQ